MRPIAGVALTVSAMFLVLMAVLINSSALFYMSTAIIATIGASRLQAWLSVRGLRFERRVPSSAQIGDLITVEITVWSERKLRRPLVVIVDHLPKKMYVTDQTPSLPLAPAADQPLVSQYQIRPLRRGKFKWSGVTVFGTDALGLVTMSRNYETEVSEVIILPRPIPVSADLPMASGWGADESESGKAKGTGIEPRGIREYSHGDSLRHVHWKSSARAGRLLVKEFESGSHVRIGFAIQRTKGSDIGVGAFTSLETMVGHVVYLTEVFIRQGAKVQLPTLEESSTAVSESERIKEVLYLLAGVEADQTLSLGEELIASTQRIGPGSIVYALICTQDHTLSDASAVLRTHGIELVALIYDGSAFKEDQSSKKNLAVDEAYMASLRIRGVRCIVMPTGGLAEHD